jgi:hypothetical protein
MGWKNVKERFNIDYIVAVEDGKILIGTPYIHDIASIDMATGAVSDKKGWHFIKEHCPDLLFATDAEMLALINEPDTFSQSLPVYTYEGGEILEKQCEEYGWPNITHDGMVMYNNNFFKEKDDAIETAIRNARARIGLFTDMISQRAKEIVDASIKLQKERANLERLEEMKKQENS